MLNVSGHSLLLFLFLLLLYTLESLRDLGQNVPFPVNWRSRVTQLTSIGLPGNSRTASLRSPGRRSAQSSPWQCYSTRAAKSTSSRPPLCLSLSPKPCVSTHTGRFFPLIGLSADKTGTLLYITFFSTPSSSLGSPHLYLVVVQSSAARQHISTHPVYTAIDSTKTISTSTQVGNSSGETRTSLGRRPLVTNNPVDQKPRQSPPLESKPLAQRSTRPSGQQQEHHGGGRHACHDLWRVVVVVNVGSR